MILTKEQIYDKAMNDQPILNDVYDVVYSNLKDYGVIDSLENRIKIQIYTHAVLNNLNFEIMINVTKNDKRFPHLLKNNNKLCLD